ncbi:MAG: hypothetical protein JWN75_898 [Candidatus Saccharibacteria bacterium]|nr:hypothetical protein [Candidatus Saccharibacteria bacterium]
MKTKTQTIIKEFLQSRIAIVTGVLCSIVIGSGVVLAYGPARPTFTTQVPATYVTFNSITNNATYGDERNFTTIKDASNTSAGGWTDNITVQDGKEYLVSMLVHNNAASNLNLVATNTRVSANVPNTTGNSVQIDGYVSADNASPQKIWDSVVMNSDKKFNIAYVAGSATYYNNVIPGGQPLSNGIVTSGGALVGYNAMDGKVPGCYQYEGVATFKVKVSVPTPNFTVEKKVRLNGTTEWQKSINAAAGQKVDYQIGYANTGTTAQTNVIAKDTLPAGVGYVTGSTTVKNADNPTGNGLAMTSNELVGANGINFGNYAAGANAYIRFTATLPSNDKLALCGPNQLINTATVATQNGEKSDTATVTVNKTNCTPVPIAPATTLPTTGPAEVVAGLMGIAAITIGVVYYFKSRRDLEHAIHEAQAHPTGKAVTPAHTPIVKR